MSSPSEANANNPIIGYDNQVTSASLAATSEDDNYPATNLANPATDQIWKSIVTTSQSLTVTITSVDPIDYMAVAGHNFNTAGVSVSIQVDTGSGYAEVIATAIPTTDGPQIYRFAPVVAIGVKMVLAASADEPQAAVLYAGKLLILQRRLYVGHTPLPYGRRTTVTNGRSEQGNFLGRIVIGSSLESEINLENLTPAFYRSYLDPFILAAREAPFFFSWRPSDYQSEVGYAWLTNDPQPTNDRSNGMMGINLQLSGIA